MPVAPYIDKHQYYLLLHVRKHDSPEDLWMVIHNKVYDISSFALKHPGGIEVLVDCGGVDATEAFDDVGHSERAVMMLEPYYKGELAYEDRKSRYIPKIYTPNELIILQITEKSVFRRLKTDICDYIGPNFTLLLFSALAVTSLLLYLGLQRSKVVI